MQINAQPVRGTKDFLPTEMQIRDAVQQIIVNMYNSFGFSHIQAPMMEDISRLDKSDGGENLALIFKILKRGQKLDLTRPNLTENDLVDMGLRYDLTVPLARYYANNRHLLPHPFKALHMDRVFRAERPQKGRYREFYQCDIDILGDASTAAEKELIYVTSQAILAIGFRDFKIRVNDRRLLTDMVLSSGFTADEVPSVCIVFDKRDKVGLDGVRAELEEKGFAAAAIEKFMAYLSSPDFGTLDFAKSYARNDQVVSDLQQVIDESNQMAAGRYSVVFDPSLVRGQGYYTGMVFEISCGQYASSVGGGGRYDKMVGKELGEDVPAVGFSIGFERICDVLMEHPEIFNPAADIKKLVLIYNDTDAFADVMVQAEKLRQAGFWVNVQRRAKKLGKQLDNLMADGYGYSFIFGEYTEPKKLEKKA